jgi:hypothetical protein
VADLIRDDAPGEYRAAVVEAGEIVELHIQRSGHLVLGQAGTARVGGRVAGGTLLITDDGRELLVRQKMPLSEGARAGFEIAREALPEPGLIKRPEARLSDAPPRDADACWNARFAPAADTSTADTSVALDIALAGQSVAGDAVISFQRTKAGLVFDVDGAGDPLALNIAAAQEIARLLRLYQVGGMTMIDFIATDSKTARIAIGDAVDAASAADARAFERTAVNGFGLMQIVRPRPRPSVLDHLFGTRIASLSDETQALWLIRDAARSTGFGPRTITALPRVATLLDTPLYAPALADAARLTGAAITVIADPAVTGYGHAHVAQA